MIIRLAEINDLDSINEIYNQAIDEQCTADTTYYSAEERMTWFNQHDKNKYPVYVYEQNEKVFGWISFSAYRNRRPAVDKTAEISFYVHRDHRKNGIAAAMISFAKNKAADYGFKNLFAIILQNNTASLQLIQKCNFRQWGFLPCVADFNGNVFGHYYFGINF